QLHVVEGLIAPEFGLPLIAGFDFGLTPALIVMQLQGETLCVLREFIEINMGIERFSTAVIPQLRLMYPEWADLGKDWITCVDPSGDARKDTDEKTCVQILNSKGFRCILGPIPWEERRHSVVHYLKGLTSKGKLAFQISKKGCPITVKGFQG
ncbi:unnamed protein product, partial [marine sediment metagenome]